MKEQKKSIRGILMPVLSGILGIALVLGIGYFAAYAPQKDTLAAAQNQNTTLTAQKDAQTKINKERSDAYEQLKAEYEAAAKDANAKKEQIKKVNEQKASAQQKLDKANRGLTLMSRIDALFKAYERESASLSNSLNEYYIAVDNNDMAGAAAAESDYMYWADEINSSYEEIQSALSRFRKGTY